MTSATRLTSCRGQVRPAGDVHAWAALDAHVCSALWIACSAACYAVIAAGLAHSIGAESPSAITARTSAKSSRG